jgi:hypothetical protein
MRREAEKRGNGLRVCVLKGRYEMLLQVLNNSSVKSIERCMLVILNGVLMYLLDLSKCEQ